MAEISITQAVTQAQALQPAPQAAAPTVDVGNSPGAVRSDQVVNVSARISGDGSGRPQQDPGQPQGEIVDRIADDNEQASANIVLNRTNGSENVVVRLRYSVSEEQVYLEIVDLDTNATLGRVPRERVQGVAEPLPIATSDESTGVSSSGQFRSPQAAVSDINESLERFFEQV